MADRIHLGGAIKRIRKAKKIQQKVVAAELGITQSAGSYLEGKSMFPRIETLTKVAAIMDVPVEAILIWAVQEQNISQQARVLLGKLKKEIIK